MPWDATRLRVAPMAADGWPGASGWPPAAPRSRSPSPNGRPTASSTSSPTGRAGGTCTACATAPAIESLAPMDAEFADPAWVFGRSSYGFGPDGSIVATPRRNGRDEIVHIVPGRILGEVETPYTEFESLVVGRCRDRRRRRSADRADGPRPVRPDDAGRPGILRTGEHPDLGPGARVGRPRSIEFPWVAAAGPPTRSTTRPTNPGFRAPEGEKPPLVVLSHGGPTSNAYAGLDLVKQFLTSRGIGIVDVDYGGSTGYGRDVPPAARRAVGCRRRRRLRRGGAVPRRARRRRPGSAGHRGRQRRRLHDPRRPAFRDVFAAGISLFGVGDLELLDDG